MSVNPGGSQQQREWSYLFDRDFRGSGQPMLYWDACVAVGMDGQFHADSSISNLICCPQDHRFDSSVLRPWKTIEPKARALAGPDSADGGGRREMSDRDEVAWGHDDTQPVSRANERARPQYGHFSKTSGSRRAHDVAFSFRIKPHGCRSRSPLLPFD